MPREVRCVLFDREEVRVMLTEFLFKRSREHKGAKILRIQIADDAGGPLAQIIFAPPHAPGSAILHTSAVLEAALMFCAAHRVPLPRGAVKNLEIAGPDLALISMYRLEHNPTVVGSKVSHTDMTARSFVETLMKSASPVVPEKS